MKVVCPQCKGHYTIHEMSEDCFLEICNGCDMDNMYKDMETSDFL